MTPLLRPRAPAALLALACLACLACLLRPGAASAGNPSADVATAGAPTPSKSSTRDAAFEARIAHELAERTPEASSLFADGTAAADANDAARASELFGRVHQLAPWFTHARRWQCGAELELGHHDRALALCGEALAASGSAENEAALARVLASPVGDARPSREDLHAALAHADRAAMLDRKSAFAEEVRCQIALAGGDPKTDLTTLRSCSEALDLLAPDAPSTAVFDVILALSDGSSEDARKVIDRAQRRGMDAKTLAALEGIVDGARPLPVRAFAFLWRALLAWALVFIIMLASGFALSRVTLRAIARSPSGATGHPSGAEAWLRKAYGGVLWAACAYYYASIPLLVVVVLATTLGLVYAIFASGWIAPKLFIVLAIVAFASIRAIGRSLFARGQDEDPGPRLDLKAHPRVRALLDEVAARVGTRPVDIVFMTPFTDLAVFDRGGMLWTLKNVGGARAGSRCLILGAGVLDGMSVRTLKSVVAHEYGHFRNEDTAGGGFALSVRRSLNAMAHHLARGGAASPLNPAWWFVRGFGRAFLAISQGASRLQEVLADRWAAFAYGSADFARGLQHVIERRVRFDAHLDATLGEVMPERRALANLYTYVPGKAPAEADLRSAIDVALTRAPSPYDSHPCPEDRLALVRALASEGSPRAANDELAAWSLFDERPALERAMTEAVRARVHAVHGVTLPAGTS